MPEMEMPEDDAKRAFCWGILFHLQGREKESKVELNKVINSQGIPGAYVGVCRKLIEYGRYGPPEKIRDTTLFEKRSYVLNELIEDLDKVLDPGEGKGSRLALECPRGQTKGEANDGPERGYSRDRFKRILDGVGLDLALASAVYLLRGHAIFFCRPKSARDFNAAKVSLNDYFQCGQLGTRLYRSLKTCHSRAGSQQDYFKAVLWGSDPSVTPETSPYFIWSILQMLEIQRGNIYSQIDYLDEASRFYRHFWRRQESLQQVSRSTSGEDSGPGFCARSEDFITDTVVRAYLEVSKIQFDRGYFLESLISQILCLACLLEIGMHEPKADRERALKLFGDVYRVIRFLSPENLQSVFDTERIDACFGFGEKPSFLRGSEKIDPLSFQNLIPDKYLEFAVEVFARIGLTLASLQGSYSRIRSRSGDEEDGIRRRQRKRKKWLGTFFNAHEILGAEKDILPSRHGFYYNAIESQFDQRLSESIDVGALDVSDLTEDQFYETILAGITKNTLDTVSIPRRNQRVLMRRGYRFRRREGDLSRSTVFDGVEVALKPESNSKSGIGRLQDKLVVLRRWQSVNPKIPRPGGRRLRGGGYFLFWQCKGIVIDPGYDFIQNFYDEGFSLGDIDAVLVTHSHPDHDDDLSTLTTLVREWNEFYESSGYTENDDEIRKIDLFLNESTNLKFSAWLASSGVRIGRVIPLPSVWWDKDSNVPSEGMIRGGPAKMDLRGSYNLEMEIIPAWHDDVIGKTQAIGVKFHLYYPGIDQEVGIVGYTGDTGAYGHCNLRLPEGEHRPIEYYYEDCDVLIAHLGDLRIRELLTLLGKRKEWYEENIRKNPLHLLFRDWFHDSRNRENLDNNENVTPARVRDLFQFFISLDLIPQQALLTRIRLSGDHLLPIATWLRRLTELERFGDHTIGPTADGLERALKEARNTIFGRMGYRQRDSVRRSIELHIQKAINGSTNGLLGDQTISDKRLAWALVGFLCGFCIVPWQYPYHLGIFGLYRVFSEMLKHWKESGRNERVFIVGELPEELANYRHKIARRLNMIEDNAEISDNGEILKTIRALTGDIGLHVGLEQEGTALTPKVRCAYCNYNNEMLLSEDKPHYHRPSKILEVPIKRLNSAMMYLCTAHDHCPEQEDFPVHFLSRPNLRVI
jgi:hypothetical protein